MMKVLALCLVALLLESPGCSWAQSPPTLETTTPPAKTITIGKGESLRVCSAWAPPGMNVAWTIHGNAMTFRFGPASVQAINLALRPPGAWTAGTALLAYNWWALTDPMIQTDLSNPASQAAVQWFVTQGFITPAQFTAITTTPPGNGEVVYVC
jgi:hypothetical protein